MNALIALVPVLVLFFLLFRVRVAWVGWKRGQRFFSITWKDGDE